MKNRWSIMPFSRMSTHRTVRISGLMSLSCLIAGLLSSPVHAQAPPPPPGGSAKKASLTLPATGEVADARDVVRVLGTFFSPEKGQIVEADRGGRVTLDRGSADGLYPGAVVMVYRIGASFSDSYTGIVLGNREDRVGWVEIRRVDVHASTGIFSGSKTVRAGDSFRMPASLIRIALVPASRYTDLAVLSHLTRAFQKSRRFSVVDPFRVDLAIRKMESKRGKPNLADPSFRVALARNLKAQNLVMIDTTLEEGKVLLTLDVAGALTGKTAFTITTGLSGVTPLMGEGSLLSQVSPGRRAAKLPPLSVPFRSVRLPIIPFFMTEGTFLPGKKPVLAISDGRGIIVGSLGKNRIRTHYRESDSRVPGNRHVFLSSGPVIPPTTDYPGPEQIAVTNIVGGALDSYVLDYDGKTFHRVAKHLPWYIRIVRMADGRVRLVGQKMGINNAFLGGIHILRWNLDHFEEGPLVSWPKVITLFGTTPLKTGSRPSFLKIAPDNHLEYYDARGDLRFKSPIFLGGYSNHFVFGRRHALLPVQSRSVRVRGRILVMAPGGDEGRPIAVVFKNIPMSAGFGNFQGYQYGQVYFYRWTGVNWTLLGELTRVKNFIRDITLSADPDTGAPMLLVGTEPVFNFMNIQNLIVKEGTVLYFHLPKTVGNALRPTRTPALLNRPAGGAPGK